MDPAGDSASAPGPATGIGVVVIGRDVGERLVASLRSVAGLGVPVVYVDSGSSDGSAERARGIADAVLEVRQVETEGEEVEPEAKVGEAEEGEKEWTEDIEDITEAELIGEEEDIEVEEMGSFIEDLPVLDISEEAEEEG